MARDEGDPTLFVPSVRMRIGNGVGLIRSVGDALDWIEHRYAKEKIPFEPALSVLRRAMQSRAPADVDEARSTFVAVLASTNLLEAHVSRASASPAVNTLRPQDLLLWKN